MVDLLSLGLKPTPPPPALLPPFTHFGPPLGRRLYPAGFLRPCNPLGTCPSLSSSPSSRARAAMRPPPRALSLLARSRPLPARIPLHLPRLSPGSAKGFPKPCCPCTMFRGFGMAELAPPTAAVVAAGQRAPRPSLFQANLPLPSYPNQQVPKALGAAAAHAHWTLVLAE